MQALFNGFTLSPVKYDGPELNKRIEERPSIARSSLKLERESS